MCGRLSQYSGIHDFVAALGMKVSHRPMIEDDGSEIVRAPVSIREVVMP